MRKKTFPFFFHIHQVTLLCYHHYSSYFFISMSHQHHCLKLSETGIDPTLHKMVHIGEMQFSFVPGGGTTDAIFVCQLQEWVIKFNCHLGTADIRVRIVHTSYVIIAYTLESLPSLTQVTHNLQVTINFNNFFYPQMANGGLRDPGTHSKLPVPFNFHQISTMLLVFLENIVLNNPL